MKIKLKDNEYQCAKCKGIFEKGWSDEEAIKEAEEKFPIESGFEAAHEMDIVCDDCYKELIAINEN